jgi:tetratricopeptide (TPR) repeat protein
VKLEKSGWLKVAALLAAFAHGAPALAQGTPAAAPAAPAAAPAPAAGAVPKDPKGIKGISPFWEAVKKGDSAYAARDYDSAGAAYKEAITKDPNNPVGHLRLAEVQIQKAELKEAEQSLSAAERFAGRNATAKAKAMFMKADLQERQAAYAQATSAWKAYQRFGQQQPSAKVHQKTPPERIKRIQVAAKLVKDYAAVKERIAEHLKDAEDKARKSAQ